MHLHLIHFSKFPETYNISEMVQHFGKGTKQYTFDVMLDMTFHVFELKQFYLVKFLWFWYVIMEWLMFAMSNVTWVKRVSMLFKWEISFSGYCFSLSIINIQLFTYFCIIYSISWSCMWSIFLGPNPRAPLTLSGSHLMPPAQVCTIPGVTVWSFP